MLIKIDVIYILLPLKDGSVVLRIIQIGEHSGIVHDIRQVGKTVEVLICQHALVLVFLCESMLYGAELLPSIATGRHRRVSFMSVMVYGRLFCRGTLGCGRYYLARSVPS